MNRVSKIAIIVLMLSALMAPSAYAVGNPANLLASNFGGRILFTIPCTCSFNLKLILSPASPALPDEVIFQPGASILYRYGMLVPSVWVLGRTLGASTCWVGIIPFCVPVPNTAGRTAIAAGALSPDRYTGVFSNLGDLTDTDIRSFFLVPMIHMVGTSLPGL